MIHAVCRYAFNIIFNILNKSSLNAFPCPWFISAWQLREWLQLQAS
jgi:solute carrier family 35 protein E1